jgi:hypothetical protein
MKKLGNISARIDLYNEKQYMRLLHAFLACHDKWSHDPDILVFNRKDGMELVINLDVARVSFGKSGVKSRCWTENADSGFMEKALTYFIYGSGDKTYDTLLKEMNWIGKR